MPYAVGQAIITLLGIYQFVLLAYVLSSWLIAFGVLNTNNDLVRKGLDLIAQLVEPVLNPIRRVMPDLGGIDLSPIVLFLGIGLLQSLVASATVVRAF